MKQETYSAEDIIKLGRKLEEISKKLDVLAQSQTELLERQKKYQKDFDRLITIVEQVSVNQQDIASQQGRLVKSNQNLVDNLESLVNIYNKMVDRQQENKAATEHLERVVDYLLRRDKEK